VTTPSTSQRMTSVPAHHGRLAEHRSWYLSARCRTEDPSVFFHPDGERGHARRRRQQQAKILCAQCPVLSPCRHYALSFGEQFGTWGGMSEDERRRSTNATVVRVTPPDV
jgi:WhiB family redox-sensing transcriptional regulator